MFITLSIKYLHFLSMLGQPWKVDYPDGQLRVCPHVKGQSVVPRRFAPAYVTLLRHVCVHSCSGKLPLYRPESCLLVTFPHVCSHSAVLCAQHQKSAFFFHMTALHIAEKGSRAHFPTTPYLSPSFLKNVERCFYSQMPWEISWFLDSC